jgi:hypothetical protein
MQFAPTMVASIVFYFVSAPVLRKILNLDPYAPEALQQRRAAVLDFIAAALFTDRGAGLKLAREIAARNTEVNEQETPASLAALTSHERGRQA